MISKIYIASDHAGFEYKEMLKPFLRDLGHAVEDLGPLKMDENDDYPDFISLAAKAVSVNPENSRGVILGGSGQGEAIVANRFPNVRAAVYYGGNTGIVVKSREHNNSNILSLGARFISKEEAQDAVKLWLETEFPQEERHLRRIGKIEKYPN